MNNFSITIDKYYLDHVIEAFEKSGIKLEYDDEDGKYTWYGYNEFVEIRSWNNKIYARLTIEHFLLFNEHLNYCITTYFNLIEEKEDDINNEKKD